MNKNEKVTRFNSPEEYCAYLRNIPSQSRARGGGESFLGTSYDLSVDKLVTGTREYVEAAQALIDKMASEHVFSSHQPEIGVSVQGFLPDVPSALAGVPEHMFVQYESENQNITTPLTIYVETLVSGGVSQDQLIKRGTAILALVLALNAIRPVELYTICTGRPVGNGSNIKAAGVVVQVPSKPVDLERASFMLCSPEYYRRLAFSSMYEHANMPESGYIQWPWNSNPTDNGYEKKMREMINIGDEDLFIQGGYLFDKLMMNDPVQWVKNMVAKHRGYSIDC